MSLDPTDKLDKSAFSATPHDPIPEKTLIWHKVEGVGYKPAAREGHSSVSSTNAVCYIFGGVEAGAKVNTTYSLDITTNIWNAHKYEQNDMKSLPCPRTLHAACMVDSIMLIHGGESDIPLPIDSEQSIKSSLPVLISVQPAHADSQSTSSHSAAQPLPVHGGVLSGDTILNHKADPRVVYADKQADHSKSKSVGGSGTDQATHKPISHTPSTPSTRTLDDLFGYNTQTNEWKKLLCGLSPLPRKGHTMCVASVQLGTTGTPHTGSECVLMFGGYCKESESVSNTVLICPMYDLLATFFNSGNTGIGSTGTAHPVNRSCTWRTLVTTGPSPPARYRHAATILHMPSLNTHYLCIFGGMSNHHKGLCDVHLLDLNTLTWSQVHRRTESGEWPDPVYGHSGFSGPSKDQVVTSTGLGMGMDQVLLVFGGMGIEGHTNEDEDEESESIRCRNALLECDVLRGVWRRLTGSLSAPTARVSHAASVCTGYSLSHPLPVPLTAGAPRPDARTMLSMMQNDNKAMKVHDTSLGGGRQYGVVVMYGGRSESLYPADCWALDLTWRVPGIDGYDQSVAERTTQALSKSNTLTATSGGSPFPSLLTHSSSLSALPTTTYTGTNTGTHTAITSESLGYTDNGIGNAFHRVRRERALMDVHLNREKVRADAAQIRNGELETEILRLKNDFALAQVAQHEECRQLRLAIEAGTKREMRLVRLFEEAQKLMILSGIERVLEKE